MAKKKKREKGPNNAYLMSFGDTMTTLLAFFIVLNSLAEDQTGANLYKGTGSFVRAMNTLGLSGHITGDGSHLAIAQSHTHPDYIAPSDEATDEQESLGPDENANDIRVIDRETEDFQRFINELQRVSRVAAEAETRSAAVFDFFTPLQQTSPRLSSAYHRSLAEVLPLLYRPGYVLDVVVWATSPNPTARTRAAREAAECARNCASWLDWMKTAAEGCHRPVGPGSTKMRGGRCCRCWFAAWGSLEGDQCWLHRRSACGESAFVLAGLFVGRENLSRIKSRSAEVSVIGLQTAPDDVGFE